MRSLVVESRRERLIGIVSGNDVLCRAWRRVSYHVVRNYLEVVLFSADDAVGYGEDLGVKSARSDLSIADSALTGIPKNVVANYG